MTTNVDAAKILAFDASDSLMHSRRLAVQRGAAADPPVSAKKALQRWRSGGWSPRRSAFESLWRHGRRIIYGAVNIGGLGTRGRYGPFCLVINDPTAAGRDDHPSLPPRVGVLPRDSAQGYTNLDATVEGGLAAGDVACWESRGDVVVAKHAYEVADYGPAAWASMICRPDHYTEVLVADPIRMVDVDAVRVSRTIRRLMAADYSNVTLNETERRLTAALAAIMSWEKFGIRIEVIK